jgi:DNA repair protein RadA/Sms
VFRKKYFNSKPTFQMAKVKTAFFCQNCGAQHAKWMGQCTTCNEWNTLVEEIIQKEEKHKWNVTAEKSGPNKALAISQIQIQKEQRIGTQNQELDSVLGGGLVPGSVVLLGGEPGIGKSTLLLEIALKLKEKVLYVSGEESQSQIKMRAERLGKQSSNCLILTETCTQNIFKNIEIIAPEILVIDSIQTLYTEHIEASPGSVSQIKESTSELIKFAKETGVPVLVIGHINKEGSIAGPKILEHMVDVVLQFEGDRNHSYRILRAQKNRFGSTSELGIYEMLSSGLREVSNPSEILISEKDGDLSGTAIAATLEGMRPLMIEVQALVSSAVYGTPQRSATGYNLKRLNMILAVLEKRAGFRLGAKDVFLNITGGIHVDDPAIDLAVITAILSSNNDEAIPQNYCFAAEIGLAGEIRAVNKIEQRISEAEKLGFDKVFVSKFNKISKKNRGISVVPISKIEDLYTLLF